MKKTTHTKVELLKTRLISSHQILIMLLLAMTFTATSISAEGLTEHEGLIEPFKTVNIGTPLEGVVDQVYVQRSDLIEKGASLVQLEASVEKILVDRAAALVKFEGEIKLQKERLAFAKRIHKRVEDLFNNEAISAEKKDEAESKVTLAQASLLKAKESRILAKIDLKRAQALLDRLTIKSPISGVVVEQYVSPGEFVDNQPLMKLAQLDPLRVEVVLPATMLNDIPLGTKADIKPENQNGITYSATVIIVDKVIDSASGTFGVRL
ncbi:MAG: efflux RND transporter periplasmic adaptor subunit, partial [Desulfocapsa sp.]|nr:efflux RND transporter periplasmic adaptor subunit [Desulfocapsa sp.]